MEWLDNVYWGNTVLEYLIFLAILLIAFLLKRIGTKLIAKFFHWLMGRFKGGAHVNELTGFIKGPIETLILVIIVYAGIMSLSGPDHLEDHPIFITALQTLNILFQITLVFIFIWLIFRIFDFIALGMLRKKEQEENADKIYLQAIPFGRDLIKAIFFLTATVFVFGVVFGFNVTSLIAGLGIGGLAIALAAQETLANLLASFTIFLDKPFKVGDFIQVGDMLGVVEKIGFRSTRLRTLEKSYLSVPNKMLVDSTVDNLTLRTYRRVRFSLGVTYQTTVEQLKNITADIKKAIDDHPNTTNDGVVRFYEFSDSSLDIVVNFFIDTMDWASYMQIREEINFMMMEIVKNNGSSIAYPTRTLHMYDDEKKKDPTTENQDQTDENDSGNDDTPKNS